MQYGLRGCIVDQVFVFSSPSLTARDSVGRFIELASRLQQV